MTPTDIRALSGAINRGLDLLNETVCRADTGGDTVVLKQLEGIRGMIVDLRHDYVLGGLDSIADRRAEDDVRDAEFTRGCAEYHRRRDYEMEGVL